MNSSQKMLSQQKIQTKAYDKIIVFLLLLNFILITLTMSLNDISRIDFRNITEQDQYIMGTFIYNAFYENYYRHHVTDPQYIGDRNTFKIDDHFVKCFLASNISKQIAQANMPLHRPYAKILEVDCLSQDYYHEFVGNEGINYLLDLLRILDNVGCLKLRGASHRNAAIFLALMNRPSIKTLDFDFIDIREFRHPVHYWAGREFFRDSLRSVIYSIQNINIGCGNGYFRNQILMVLEGTARDTTRALPLESLRMKEVNDSFSKGGKPIGRARFWEAINQPRLSNLRHLDIDMATEPITMMQAHQALSNNTTITSIKILHYGFCHPSYKEENSLWVHRLLNLFLLETNSVHTLNIGVRSQPNDLFFNKVILFARMRKTRKIILRCVYTDNTGVFWHGLNQAQGTSLLEAVKENHRLEEVDIEVLDPNTRYNINMYLYMHKLGLDEALTGGQNVVPVVERSYKFIRKLFDNVKDFSQDDEDSSDDDNNDDDDDLPLLAMDTTFTFLKMNSHLFRHI